MRSRKNGLLGVLAAFAMLVIILDTKTALNSAQDGLQLCIRTVLPSLLPFFVLTSIVNSRLLGRDIPILHPIGQLCNITKGAESIFLLGLLGGYPVGAQLITQSYRDGALSEASAKRMLGYCSNAGPAFLFGMLCAAFLKPTVPWLLWGVHIVSALMVGWLLPTNEASECRIATGPPVSPTQAMQNAIRNIAVVCGWVVVFRIIIGFCERWFMWLFPLEVRVLLSGLLELSNGCILLNQLPQEGARFILASVMLSFGGLCVGMQTLSVTQPLGSGWYFPGKVMQAVFSLILSSFLQPYMFSKSQCIVIPAPLCIVLCMLTAFYLYWIRRKKVVAFGRRMVYNTDN